MESSSIRADHSPRTGSGDSVSTDLVQVPRQLIEKWQVLSETVRDFGVVIKDIDGEPTPNAALWRDVSEEIRSLISHPDDKAVDRFAAAMKKKLAYARDVKGRGGWETDKCSEQFLSTLLHEHVIKGDPVDVANLAMMLHQRGESIAPVAVDLMAIPQKDEIDRITWHACDETRPLADKYVLVKGVMDGPHDWRIRLGWYDNQKHAWRVDGASWLPLKWAYLPTEKESEPANPKDNAIAN